MPAKEGLTVTTDITVRAREVDFVTRFTKNWDALREILGIVRPIKKAPGTVLTSYVASMKSEGLQGGATVGEGEEIPYTEFQVEPVSYGDVTIEKYAKAVSIESVAKFGATVAIQKTDDAFLNELQSNVMGRFYTFLATGRLTGVASGFQAAIAEALGLVTDKFKKMHRDATEIVVFVNTLDYFKYLGTANITLQTSQGIQYIENFMGARYVILSSEIDRSKVYATPIENIDLYYVDPSDSEFAQLGLQYTVEGETNLIGFHANGNYSTAVGESYALMGMTLWAEYLDGIANIDIDDSFLTDLTVAPDDADATYPWTDKKPADFQSNVAINGGEVTGELTFIEGGLAPSGTLSGDGYFLALKFSNFASGLTYANVQVGIVPSATGMPLQTLDSDKNAVFKVTDKNTQKIKVVQSDASGHKNVQLFGLSGLTLGESTAEA